MKHNILAKKGFKKGLEDLFGEPTQVAPPESSLSLFPGEKRTTAKPTKKSSKRFSSRLDAILADAFEDEKPQKAAASKSKSRLTGLDLLIRQTGGDQPTPPQKSSLTRRLTLAFDKEQLEKLKEIAKEEGIYLKDLIAQLVDRYLERHSEK